MNLLLRNVRPGGGDPTDVLVRDGRIAGFGPSAAEAPHVPVEDGEGALLLPGLVDAHCHLDKTLWGLPWVPNTSGSVLADRISNEQRRRKEFGLPSPEPAAALLGAMIANGTSFVRTHTDVDPELGLSGMRSPHDPFWDRPTLLTEP
ncbi:hypothetical protein ABT261_41875, partial [Amycolatopsis sp. NPDC000740]